MSEEKKLELNNLPPEEADLQERIQGFDKEIRPILGKYELGLGAQARIHNGLIVADPVLMSSRKRSEAHKPEAHRPEALANPEA